MLADPVRMLALVCAIAGASTAEPSGQQGAQAASDRTIRSGAALVTSDVIVRDAGGRFVGDLTRADFEVFEDGVRQDIVMLTMSQGGGIVDKSSASVPSPVREAGRILLLFIDDLHLDFVNTGRLRQLAAAICSRLVRQGDVVAVVSTGRSSLSLDLTDDRERLTNALKQIAGAGLAPADLLAAARSQPPFPEVRQRAHAAFSTAIDMLGAVAASRDRRKAVIYISNGYAFDPSGGGSVAKSAMDRPSSPDPADDLTGVIRTANRVNASIYTIDPRGLVAGERLTQRVDPDEWNAYLRATQHTLRVLAESTGGVAVVDRDDLERALDRIDSEISDYYVFGYYSSNVDPARRQRQLRVAVRRPGIDVKHRSEYWLEPVR
jgi:VWFA-related protein